MFVGLTALSVEISTKDLTFAEIDSSARLKVPNKLFSIDFEILLMSSTSGHVYMQQRDRWYLYHAIKKSS